MQIGEIVLSEAMTYGPPGSHAMGMGNFGALVNFYSKPQERTSDRLLLNFGNENSVDLPEADVDKIADYYNKLPTMEAKRRFVLGTMAMYSEFVKVGRRLNLSVIPAELQPSAVQPELPFDKRQGDLFEKEAEISRGAVKSAELSALLKRAYARYPQAQSDIEALVMYDLDQQKATSQNLAQQDQTNQRQDDVMRRLNDLTRQQSQKISALDKENDDLSDELDRIEAELPAMAAQAAPGTDGEREREQAKKDRQAAADQRREKPEPDEQDKEKDKKEREAEKAADAAEREAERAQAAREREDQQRAEKAAREAEKRREKDERERERAQDKAEREAQFRADWEARQAEREKERQERQARRSADAAKKAAKAKGRKSTQVPQEPQATLPGFEPKAYPGAERLKSFINTRFGVPASITQDPTNLLSKYADQPAAGEDDQDQRVAENNRDRDHRIADRYQPDEFDRMVLRLRDKAREQERRHGPVDIAKLAQRLRDIEAAQDQKKK